MGSRRVVAAALAVLALSGCAWAEAAASGSGAASRAPAATPSYEPHPATRLVERLAGGPEGGLPDLTGARATQAAETLRSSGLRARVVAYGPGPVSAQYPEPGSASPRDGVVLLWTGTPPAPPEPAPEPAPEPQPAPGASPDAAPDAAQADPAPGASQTEPAPDSAQTGAGQPDASQPDASPQAPHPHRVNPLRLPASAPGDVLEGLASWYGPGFAGRTTACGGVFDPDALTLATRELRCGTAVLVTGPGGESVEAVATDWGPAEWTGRRFDLSRATFEAVHGLGAGVVHVRVEVLAP